MSACPYCKEEHPVGVVFCPAKGFPLALAPGERGCPILGRTYELLHCAGEGGMGRVYVARHQRLGKLFALKLLRPDLLASPEMTQRFEHEAQMTSAIEHPNVVTVTDFGQSPEGFLFLVMELLTGRSLADLLADDGRLPVARAVGLTLQILAGLDAAHQHRVVHRDLKPENVFLSDRGPGDVVKVLDFGIARCFDRPEDKRLTQTGTIVGTPQYMAPEQAMGLPVDHLVDVYGAGLLLYEMTTGEQAFDGPSYAAVLAKVVAGTVARPRQVAPDLAPGLEDVILRAVAREPKQRYQSARELAAALRALGLVADPGAERARATRAALERAPTPAAQPPAPTEPAAPRVALTPGPPAVGGQRPRSASWWFPSAAIELLPLDAAEARRATAPRGPAAAERPLAPTDRLAAATSAAPLAGPITEAGLELAVEPPAPSPPAPPVAAPPTPAERGGATPAAGVWDHAAARPPKRPSLGRSAAIVVGLVAILVGLSVWHGRCVREEDRAPAVTGPVAPLPVAPAADAGAEPLDGAPLRVTLEVKPATATVLLDGKKLSERVVDVPRDGQTHTVVCSAPGYVTYASTFVARKPEHVVIELRRAR
jgi:eukaryotic-like serine/threonine-protein kinase